MAVDRASVREQVLIGLREGGTASSLARQTGIPRRTIARWAAEADLTVSAPPDAQAKLQEDAWNAAVKCVARAVAALPEATAYDAARSAGHMVGIALDLRDGRKGHNIVVNDNRDQRSITLAGAPTEGLLQLAEAIERMGDELDH